MFALPNGNAAAGQSPGTILGNFALINEIAGQTGINLAAARN